jgi:uncharacterized protein (DUF362 family)
LAGYAGWEGARSRRNAPKGPSPVAVIKASSYSDDLAQRILRGVRECGLDVRDQKVLLKPNLVEFDPNTCINTDVSVVAAAYEVFKALGASEVIIGEGPGHRRDTYSIVEMARYRDISKFDDLFVDPNTALRADLVVSLAKMKTHHWAGATLSMKNFFGLVPGSVYGWPKNELHHIGIPESIVELNRIFHRSFAIVDGIVGMEGNGPIQGTPKPANVLVMGHDLPAVDATCCRIMGIDPAKIEYLRMASEANLGNVEEIHIEQRGEKISELRTNFALIESFRGLRLS